MKNIHRYLTVRLLAAVLMTVAVTVLSTLAMHAPAQTQGRLTLKDIRTDKVTSFCANHRPDRCWFVEAVLPSDHYADRRVDRCWFVEAVLPTGDSNAMTENLNSVAAML